MISNLSEMPPNWIKVRFDEIAENITDRIDKPKESGLEYYIGLEHLDTDQIRIKRFGSTDDVEATKFLCKKGDIIFGKRNAYLRKVAVTDRDAVVSAHSMVIRPKGNLIVPDFLPCFMQSSVFWKTAHAISEGSMSPTIKWKTLAKQEFWIPSIEEQKKVAEILWSIEDNAEKNEKIIETAERLKNELFSELLTKGIGHEKFKKTQLGNIPEKWEVYCLSDVINIIGGGTPQTTNSEYWDGGIPWISVEDFPKDGMYIESTIKTITEKGLNESSTKLLQQDDLIISARGTVGLVAKIAKPMAFNQSCYGISSTNKVTSNYAYYLLTILVEDIKHSSYGSTFKAITRKNFDLFKVAIPPLEEQKQISEKMDQFYALQKKTLQNIENLNHLKKKITDEFLKGKVQV